MSYTVSFTLNRQILTGLIIGLVLGSVLTVGGARLMKNTSTDNTGGQQPVAAAPGNDNNAPAAPTKQNITISETDHIRGDKNAPVVLVEYSDFECPYCVRHYPTMQAIFAKYGDKIAWVHRNFPLSFHAQSMPAALAAECSSEQGKFWEFADKLYGRLDSEELGDSMYTKIAGELGLNTQQFSDCYTSGKYRSKIQAEQDAASAYGVDGTPATFVNGILVSGAIPQAQLETAIDQALKQ